MEVNEERNVDLPNCLHAYLYATNHVSVSDYLPTCCFLFCLQQKASWTAEVKTHSLTCPAYLPVTNNAEIFSRFLRPFISSVFRLY